MVILSFKIQCSQPLKLFIVQRHFIAQEAVHAAVFLVYRIKGGADEILAHRVEPGYEFQYLLVVGVLAAVFKRSQPGFTISPTPLLHHLEAAGLFAKVFYRSVDKYYKSY